MGTRRTSRNGPTEEGSASLERRLSELKVQLRQAKQALKRETARRKWAERALQEQARPFSGLFEDVPDALFVEDPQGNVLDANPAACRLHGVERDQLVGRNLWALVPPQERAQVLQDVQRLLAGEVDAVEGYSWRADGRAVPVELRARRITDAAGPAVLIHMRDISRRKEAEGALARAMAELEQRVAESTMDFARANERLREEILEREQAQRALRESEERFSTAFQEAPVAIGIITLAEGRFLDLNESLTSLTGYAPADVIGLTLAELELFRQPDQNKRILNSLKRQGSFRNLELQVCTRAGETRDVLLSAEVLELIGERCSLMMFYDITERKRLEREVLEISEDERRRIGHELHDDLGQQLTGLVMLSQLLQEELKKEQSRHVHAMSRITDRLSRALSYTRHLSRMLSPVMVEAEGLMDALDRLAENTDNIFGVPCWFEAAHPVLVKSHEVATHLYRIAQEAVNNAVKHAHPKEIGIELIASDGKGVLRICDDGVGISDESLHGKTGMGLHTMNYRADIVGATLSVQRGAQGGTVVECHFDI